MTTVSVIGPKFVSADAQEIIVDTYCCGTLVITDSNHRVLIKVKPLDSTFHTKRVILDPNDTPILTLCLKIMSVHARWNVFRGESKSDSNMIFSVKTENMISLTTSVEVLLANNKHDSCDFMFKGSWSKRNCSLYIGNSDSSTPIAQMHPLKDSDNKKYCEGKFTVTINANVDYAFVVTIIAIVDAMKNPDKKKALGRLGAVNSAVNAAGNF